MASTRTSRPCARPCQARPISFPPATTASFQVVTSASIPAVLLQITDTHLFASVDTTQRGVNTQASLDTVLDHARADPRWPPDAIVVTGDIVHDESRAGYLRFRKILEALEDTCFLRSRQPRRSCRSSGEECLSAPRVQVCGDTQLGTWRVILLSTFGDGEVAGALGSAELARMEATVEKYSGEHTLICMHHPPLPMGSAWLDAPGLSNSEAFLDLVRRHTQVRAVLWGHVHQASDRYVDGVRFLSTPSTCAQFRPDSDEFSVDNLPPGMRWLTLNPDGGLTTEVVRIGIG